MTSRFRAISGLGAKGPACFLLETDGKRLMLDLGYGPDPDVWPDLEDVGTVDALVLSHGHRDHVGGLSLLGKIGRPPVYATEIVARALPAEAEARLLPVRGHADILGITVETGRNGHAPGGIWVRFPVGSGFLYMGDHAAESPLYAFDPPPRSGAMTIDASYGNYERSLADSADELAALLKAGPTLLPAPANGRGPEIALHLFRRGMTKLHADEATRSALQRLAGADGVSVRDGLAAELQRLAAAVQPIDGANGIILATPADCASGETAKLVAQWHDRPEPAIVLTGYVPPGTPAQRLLDKGRAKSMRWNVHPRLSDNVALVRSVGASTVIPAFCNRQERPRLAAAFAPAAVTMDRVVTL